MSKFQLKLEERFALAWVGLIFSLVLVGAIGYVANIVKLFGADFSTLSGELVVRLAGILVVPVGAVAGYF